MKKIKNVLITGAAGGFGTVIIEALLTEGFTITGAMRDAKGRNKQIAENLEKMGVFVVEIDVTNDINLRTYPAALADFKASQFSALFTFGT